MHLCICSSAALDRTLAFLQTSKHLCAAALESREIMHEGVSLDGCDAFIMVADADQSRLLVLRICAHKN
jgi:hypothetical protein